MFKTEFTVSVVMKEENRSAHYDLPRLPLDDNWLYPDTRGLIGETNHRRVMLEEATKPVVSLDQGKATLDSVTSIFPDCEK